MDTENVTDSSADYPPVIHLRRTRETFAPPTVIETDLPGHFVDEEFTEDYLSYMVELDPSASLLNPNTQSGSEARENRDWLKAAKEHKDRGNSLFKTSNKYSQIEREYRIALHCLRRTNRTSESNELRAMLYSNLTACDLAKGEYAAARRHAGKALRTDPNNVKALYRRAQARMHGAFDLIGAEEDLELAIKIAPNDDQLKRALAQLKQTKNKAAKTESNMAKKMFAGNKT